jgi:beta-catenin-like protein 1
MTSIDELFRASSTTSTKRKADPTSTFTSNKAARHGNATSPHSSTNGTSTYAGGIPKIASVADGPPTDEEDIEAGPALPGDLEDEAGDDEEGRFFGGGVSQSEKEVLDYIDANDAADGELADEAIDNAWLRRTALSFEKKISKNAEMRAKYDGQPQKFMTSEADLDAEIKGLSILAEHAELYPEFAKLGCVGSLVGLLSHENTDIAIAAIQLLGELTDEDVNAEEEQWKTLVDELIKNDVVSLLVQNLDRLDEERDEDREGVYHILEVLENLLQDSKNLESQADLITWLRTRIKARIGSKRVSQNQQYAAEILAMLLQTTGPGNREAFVKSEGVDTLLELLSLYRKVDPEKDSDEEEWAENLFDCLTCLVDFSSGATAFLAGEGVELALIMLREGKMSKVRSLRILDHGMSGEAAEAVCEKFVEAAGLKTVFGMFMKRQDKETTEHLIGIFASLLRYQPANSSGRIRTLAKFVEKEYEKIGKLVQLRKEYAGKVLLVNDQIEKERLDLSKEERDNLADQWLSMQLDAGLFPLQTLDVILSWLVAEDDGARKKITDLLGGLGILSASLKEQLDGMDVGPEQDVKALTGKEMLEALLRCI